MKNTHVAPIGSGFEKCIKVTRRVAFLTEVDRAARRGRLCALGYLYMVRNRFLRLQEA